MKYLLRLFNVLFAPVALPLVFALTYLVFGYHQKMFGDIAKVWFRDTLI